MQLYATLFISNLGDIKGTKDVVCDHDGAREWFDNCCNISDKEFKSYEGWMHKSESSKDYLFFLLTITPTVHDEGPHERKTQFANDIANWILARAN